MLGKFPLTSGSKIKLANLRLSPIRVLFVVYLLFFIGLLMVPVRTDIGYSFTALIYYGICVISAFVGMGVGVIGVKFNLSRLKYFGDIFCLRTAAVRCVKISSLGLFLTLVDRFLIRGVPLTVDMFEARSVIEESGSGLVAVLAAFFSSFSAFGVILIWFSRIYGQPVRRIFMAIAIANLIAYIFLSLTLGSRSLLLVCIILHVFGCMYFRGLQGKVFTKKSMFAAILIPVVVVMSLATIMLQRLELMGLKALDSIQFSTYAYTLKPTDSIIKFLERNEYFETFGAAIYSLVLYVFHGFYEFLLLVDSYKGEYAVGSQVLWLPIKILGVIFPLGENLDLENSPGYRSGIFTTFAGPFFIDFGFFAPFFIFFIFVVMAFPYRKILTGDLRWICAALQVLVLMFFCPIMPLLQSAVGTYLLVSGVCVVALFPRK